MSKGIFVSSKMSVQKVETRNTCRRKETTPRSLNNIEKKETRSTNDRREITPRRRKNCNKKQAMKENISHTNTMHSMKDMFTKLSLRVIRSIFLNQNDLFYSLILSDDYISLHFTDSELDRVEILYVLLYSPNFFQKSKCPLKIYKILSTVEIPKNVKI